MARLRHIGLPNASTPPMKNRAAHSNRDSNRRSGYLGAAVFDEKDGPILPFARSTCFSTFLSENSAVGSLVDFAHHLGTAFLNGSLLRKTALHLIFVKLEVGMLLSSFVVAFPVSNKFVERARFVRGTAYHFLFGSLRA
ncbi:hypothetical protein [Paraburkholderia sp. BL9I2N2]|uniref:hypothetical protein n=1 Tax=Paraburkholderia sp. BL9I2N2 TaxID=1938809 RepID=UPI0010517B39|nr:hypothetical protein [Paraburkholderia sp. BL9I2N2]